VRRPRPAFVHLFAPLLALALGGCSSGLDLDILGLGPTVVLTFKDIGPKVVPNEVEDDGDSKDVVIKSRATYKPSKGSEVGLNKRMKLKSKVDGGEASVATEVEMTGNVTAGLRVAVTTLTGLVDDVTLGFIERRAAGAGPIQRLEAVWNADIDGFTMRGFENGSPAGTPIDLPGAHEVVIAILDGGDHLELVTGVPIGDDIEQLEPDDADVADLEQEEGTESATFAFGAEGLDKKGTLWIGQFTLEFGTDIAAGEAETGIGIALINGQQYLEDAQQLLDAGATGAGAVSSMYNLLNNATIVMNDGWSSLQTAIADETLAPWTQGVDAEKNVKTALGWVFPASQDMLAEMERGNASIKKVKSHVKVGLQKVELAIAQIAGFKSNSHGKLEKTLDLTIK